MVPFATPAKYAFELCISNTDPLRYTHLDELKTATYLTLLDFCCSNRHHLIAILFFFRFAFANKNEPRLAVPSCHGRAIPKHLPQQLLKSPNVQQSDN